MKLTSQFIKIARLAGKDPSKLLEEYNLTARVRGSSTANYVQTKDNTIPKDYSGYLFIDGGKLFTIPSKITRTADGKVCVFHTAYQAVQTKKTPDTPPAPPAPEKTAPKNRHQRRAEKAQKNS